MKNEDIFSRGGKADIGCLLQSLMKIFLAGGISGNLNPMWRRVAQTNATKEDVKKEVQRFGGVFNQNIFGWRSTVERRGGL